MRTPFALLGLLFLASQSPDAAVHGLQTAMDGNRVLASFVLTDAFDGRLARRIDSGLPTSIVYEIELHKDRKRWYDNRIDRTTLEVVAVHDAVARTWSGETALVVARAVSGLTATGHVPPRGLLRFSGR